MRYPTLFTSLLMPVVAQAHDGAPFHLRRHGAEPAVAGLGVLALMALIGAAVFRGRR